MAHLDHSSATHPWIARHGYIIGLTGIFGLSLTLRLWSLDRFNQLAFDEIYYVNYGVDYLTQQPLFDAHPPLGKYLIALGIWFGDHVLFPKLTAESTLTNDLAGLLLSPYSYRWLNSVVGATIPLLIAGIARQLSDRASLGLLAGSLAALDGFFLVESRFALLHVYLVAFGLLGHWCWFRAMRAQRDKQWQWQLAAGISLGACISVKWNGLGYLLGLLLWTLGCWLRERWQETQRQDQQSQAISSQAVSPQSTLKRGERLEVSDRSQSVVKPHGQRLRQQSSAIQLQSILIFIILIPVLFYGLQWLPHLQLNPSVGLLKLHQQILGFHQGDAVMGNDIHDYCSPWWSWPLLIRPIAYALSKGGEPPVYFAVYALGNPLLWWLSSLAMVMTGVGVTNGVGVMNGMLHRNPESSSTSLRIGLYLLINHAANWLPWAAVSRCTFIYHYLGSLSFSFIALAYWLHGALQLELNRNSDLETMEQPRYIPEWRWTALVLMGLIAIAFLIWLPLWLGLPLPERGFYQRLILPTWP